MSERPADPAQTYALVVGIEKYDAGSAWNLDGPVTDALEFCRWLLARNVSREHIDLFLSPLENNRPRIQESKFEAQPATRSAIDGALTTLHETKGDLLVLFWAGHGVVNGENDRRLFYADATSDNKRNLDLDSLLKSLGSSYFAGFPRQILFIDACANYAEEMQWAFKLPGEELPVGQPTGHEQFVFMAAKDGQVAKNLGKEKRGLFSQNLLQELPRDPGSAWPPDMKKLVEVVQARFGALREAGQAQQSPIYLSTRDWDGSSMSLRVGSVRGIDQLHPKTPWKLTTKEKRTLADALLACRTIQDTNARDTAIDELRAEIRFAVRRNSSAQIDVWNLITAASDYAGGIEELLEIVHMLEGDSLDWQNLQEEAMKALPSLSGLSHDRAGGI